MRGMGLTLISAILFGAVTVFSKSLLGSAGPATVGALTYFGAGLVGLFATIITPTPPLPTAGIKRGRIAFIVALILGAIIAPLLLMTGLQWTSASLASILTNIEGIATASLAWSLFREKTNATGIASVIAILSGVVCFTVSEGIVATGSIGPVLVGAAYVCWALDINLMRYTSGIDATKATAIRGIVGAIVMGSIAWIWQETLPNSAVLGGSLLTGALGFGISFILLLKALPLIGTAKAGAIFASAPIFSYLCSVTMEGSALKLSMLQLIAMILIVLGILGACADTFVRDRVCATKGRTARENGENHTLYF